ncbi:MAG: DUF1800 domain-containing protein [Ferruginibacter sp.]|nr:DUF1800 domain-containing protein [Cytophagales bacterium]
MASVPKQTRIQHLHLRAGFGEKASVIRADDKKSVKAVVKELFKNSATPVPFRLVEEPAGDLRAKKEMDPLERRMLIRGSKEQIRALNLRWLDRMAGGPDALRQKMTLFWHGHFACKARNAYFTQQYLNTLQEHALGKFGDLLHAVSKTPAMLQFLNNQQNRKDSPNENFAREVMELFTLGRGNYAESDVKNAARAFTGWGFDAEGKYAFRPNQHDSDPKTFFGKTGSFTGEDILRMILERKETARFVSHQLYRCFVNDRPDSARVLAMADRFYQSDYDIRDLMEFVFTADWFYDARNVGTHIKSPIELIVGLNRMLDIRYEDENALLFVQKVLGQVALYPPSVAGWAGGRDWIDSSSLLFRMKLPELLFQSAEVDTEAKDDGDVETETLGKRQGRQLRALPHWDDYRRTFANYPDRTLFEPLAAYLLQTPVTASQRALIEQRAAGATQADRIQQLTLALLTLPEYQLS